MKSIKIKIIILFMLCSVGLLTSCKKWLDVKPKTAVKSDDLFSTEFGFVDALTGVYVKMGAQTLYAKNLSYGFIDVLGQRYDKPTYNTAAWYNYKNNEVPSSAQSTVGGIYSNMYNIIANINNLLAAVEEHPDVLTTPKYHNLIKGEAIGLRAFLHFELLKMYGPVYVKTPNGLSIPYRNTNATVATSLLPASKIMDNVIVDLLEAERLLKDSDPKNFAQTGTDPFLYLRQFRMNVYAVKALLARAYLYRSADGLHADDKSQAMVRANDVINSTYFNFTVNNADNKILFSEHILTLNVAKMTDLVFPDFGSSLALTNLYLSSSLLNTIYEKNSGGATDFRGGDNAFVTGSDVKVTTKYTWGLSAGPHKESVPLVRLPEMYYILAECDPDPVRSASYLNTVRNNRNISQSFNLVPGTNWDSIESNGQTRRTNEIMKEYQKEFYGEGQLFYYYKRKNYSTFLNCPVLGGMTDLQYVFPVPDDEITYGKK
ncbi:RagB/SusD family nutrient uptake outer membrane protein [Pedobacter psychrodurus]|uniref:RagB/SusD family nutrient uptake outer membrane protein n=1 Tax=Pedobacter psychrodurus TaxID=2530456 RepID=A0A4R0PTX2_9SPHI|nr:RagB/SusD family nutrient uptake outer membrane protein [Pedobacter psychrodurus]TCD25462.1 RagB/SusD family nutrient uptake outer membrane protein [Pedobacter psychrodurus]